MCESPVRPTVERTRTRPEERVQTYVVMRRNAWGTRAELADALDRAGIAVDGLPDAVRWLQSYEIEEADGSVGSICFYEGATPEALRRHAAAAALPIDEIVKVADAVVRPDRTVAAAEAAA